MKNWRSVGILAFVVIGLTANDVFAGSTGVSQERSWLRTTTKSDKTPSRSADPSLGKWAAVVLLIGLGGFAWWKRRSGSRRVPTTNVSTMRISAVTRLSSRAQVVALEVQGRTLLIGATDTSITRLGWLDELPEVDLDEEEDERGFRTEKSPARTTLARTSSVKSPVHAERVSSLSKAPIIKVETAARKPSRFRELLADAIGIQPKGNSTKHTIASAPVDELVAAAEDRYVGHDTGLTHTQRMRRESTNTTALIDIEGQAKGLVARLNRPPT